MKWFDAGTKKMSAPSFGSFIKLLKLPCTGSWATAGQMGGFPSSCRGLRGVRALVSQVRVNSWSRAFDLETWIDNRVTWIPFESIKCVLLKSFYLDGIFVLHVKARTGMNRGPGFTESNLIATDSPACSRENLKFTSSEVLRKEQNKKVIIFKIITFLFWLRGTLVQDG